MAVSQTIFRSFVQIPVITLCVLGLVGCPGGSNKSSSSNGCPSFFLCIFGAIADATTSANGKTPLTAPTAPTLVKAVSVSTQIPEISLSWDKTHDDHPVAGYKIRRDGILIQDVIELQFSDTGLNRNTTYCYTVSAYDPSLNESARSDPACTTTSWAMTELDSAAPRAKVSLVVDTSDQVHIAYSTWYIDSRVSLSELLYVTNRGGFWVTESIENSRGQPTIAVDPSGAVHVGHRSRYLTNLSGEWFSEIINPGNPIGIYSLALDSIGNVHIGYKNLSNTGEFGIFNATNGGGVWTYEQTVGEEWSGHIAIAMDAFDALHIAYYHRPSKELRYMTNATGTWTGDVVESNIEIIFNIGLAVDDSSQVHLSYYGTTNRDLKYASNASGAWVIEIPDSQDDVGSGASIAVDADGKVHISYTDQTYQNLKYVSNASGTWKPMVIDSAEVTGIGWGRYSGEFANPGSTSIAVDSIGKVHISYYGSEGVWYATNR